jgi:hypothetical protein
VRLRNINRQQCSDDSDQHDSSAIESTGMMDFKTASHRISVNISQTEPSQSGIVALMGKI